MKQSGYALSQPGSSADTESGESDFASILEAVAPDVSAIAKPIVDNVIDSIVLISKRGIIYYVNPATVKMFGYQSSEMVGRNVLMLMGEPYRSEHDQYLANYFETGVAKIMGTGRQVSAMTKSGHEFPIELSVVETFVQGETYFVGVVRDISERVEAERRMKMNVRVHRAISHSLDGFISSNLWSKRDVFDSTLESLLDLTASEYGFIGEIMTTAEGLPYLKTHAITDISWNAETRALYRDNARDGLEFFNLETLFVVTIRTGEPVISNDPTNDPRSGGLPGGHPAMNSYLGLPIYAGNKFLGMAGIANRKGGYDEELMDEIRPFMGTIGSVIAGFQNLRSRHEAEQELYRAQQKLRQMATHDQLTQIMNRGSILESIENGLAASDRLSSPVSLLFIDVDHFKLINDTHGHDAGDQVLKEITATIAEVMRPSDSLGRYGGEEFLIHLQNCPETMAMDVAERIRNQVESHTFLTPDRETELNVTVSTGVASTERGSYDVDQLIKLADQAVYQAKAEGRNRVVCAPRVDAPSRETTPKS